LIAMLARYLNAPLLLLLWQVAPVDPVRISFGAGGGNFIFRDNLGIPAGVDCAGDYYPESPPSTDVTNYESGGLSAEVWARNTLRIRAAIGGITDPSGERQGTFGAAQAVLEQKHFGIGLGLASLGGFERVLQPSGSIRVGQLDGFSLRADYRLPEAGMGMIGGPRIGVGLNQGMNRKVRFFAGLATTPVPDTARRAGGFIELAVPLWPLTSKAGLSFNAFLSGVRRGFEDKQVYSLGLGGWIQP
jgi:hypothetical protein